MNIVYNENNQEKEQIVSFVDAQEWVSDVGSNIDATRTMTDSGDADLSSFFSRPIKIASYDWSSTVLSQTFNPWNLFFSANPRVINRITNYNLMRAKLHVKFVLNGNGFYYGRAMASYRPLHNQDDVSKVRAYNTRDLIEKSQRPHIFLNPTNSSGGTLVLPFVWYEDNVSVPLANWDELGEIDLDQISYLLHTTGTVDPLTISVFAWATDVSLSVPTSAEPGAIVPQSGEEEYSGVVSKPANIVAGVARSLSTISTIRPYALATEMFANMVATAAQSLGFSKPNASETPDPAVMRSTTNMANTQGLEKVYKLTMDPKQETSIDPRITGCGPQDDMLLSTIASRPSYMGAFTWTQTTSAETLLFSIRVNPCMFDLYNPGFGENEIHMIPACYASVPFRYWKGGMNYRFMVMASAFHKGRLKFVYEPYQVASNEYNTNYTEIVDIAQTKDFTINVGWGSTTTYKRVPSIYNASAAPWGVTPVTPNYESDNGVLSVYVVNELTAPEGALNSVDVAVFASADDNFQLAAPNNLQLGKLVYTAEPQSGEIEIQSGEVELTEAKMSDAPVPEESPLPTVSSVSPNEMVDKVFFGDPIKSIRNIVKRYTLSCNYVIDSGTTYMCLLTFPKFPLYPGWLPGGIHLNNYPVVSSTYNYSVNTFLNWFTPAFVCRRGGIRHKYFFHNTNGDQPLVVDRCDDQYSTYSALIGATNMNTATIDKAAHAVAIDNFNGVPGGIVQAAVVNPMVEVEHPYHSTYRFYPARRLDLTLNRSSGAKGYERLDAARASWLSGLAYNAGFNLYTAAADDFSLNFFLSTPVAYPISVLTPP